MMSLFYIGALTAYTSIFASSFASNVPLGPLSTCNIYEDGDFSGECRWKYWLYLAIFTGIEIALVLASYSEQKWMQTAMTIIRITVVLSIILTSLVSIITGTKINGGGSHSPSYQAPVYPMAIAASILVSQFAYMCHIQVPSIAQFVQDRRRNLKKISYMVNFTCFLAYLSLGLIVPAAIDDVPSLVTLSFREYSAGYSTRPWWTYILSYVIVLCPALDVLSSYPIIAVSIAQNILSFVYPGEKSMFYNPRKVLALKLFLVIFPSCISFFEYDLSIILSWTTYLGLFVMPVALPLVYMACRVLVKAESPFKSVLRSPCFTMANVVFEIVLIVFLFGFSVAVLVI
jgi:amino acid transporter